MIDHFFSQSGQVASIGNKSVAETVGWNETEVQGYRPLIGNHPNLIRFFQKLLTLVKSWQHFAILNLCIVQTKHFIKTLT